MILLAGNWKENPDSEKGALALFKAVASAKRVRGVGLAVFPPFIYLERVMAAGKKMCVNLPVGAQDVFWEERGAFTGEVGPAMLKKLGVQYVIIGHSERRAWLKETDEMVNKKIKAALAAKMKVILCVGEPLAIRRKGEQAAQRYVAAQLEKDLRGISPAALKKDLVIAYEPIWAIGTGRAARPEDVVLMALFIKTKAGGGSARNVPAVLYGGSVNAENIADFVQYKGIDGALVGGASLNAREFKKMIAVAYGAVKTARK